MTTDAKSNEAIESPTQRRALVTMLAWLKPGGGAALARFRERAAPLWEKYDVRVERVIANSTKGALVGLNQLEIPQLIQVISTPTLASFRSYVTDPTYVDLAKERDEGLSRMTAVLGQGLDVSALRPSSQSNPSGRLYGTAFVRFLPGGVEAMSNFDRLAGNLYERHGMHVESMTEVAKTIAPIGDALTDFAPERVVTFFLDTPAALTAYVADPEYKKLSSLRDTGLRSYDFFLGKAVS